MMGMVRMYGLNYVMGEIDNADIEITEGKARRTEE
jgi:hypothetical protein